jgi:hypothetical protein
MEGATANASAGFGYGALAGPVIGAWWKPASVIGLLSGGVATASAFANSGYSIYLGNYEQASVSAAEGAIGAATGGAGIGLMKAAANCSDCVTGVGADIVLGPGGFVLSQTSRSMGCE